MPKTALLILLAVGILFVSSQSDAMIYKYVDENGRMVFVDAEAKIPAKYRQQTNQIKEEKDRLSAEEYQDLQAERDRKARETEENRKAREQARRQERKRAMQTPVIVRGNHVMVPVEVSDGRRKAHLFLILDTGASSTVLHRSSLQELELNKGTQVKARVVGGSTISSERVKFRYIEVGPFRQKDAFAMVIDPKGPSLPFDGMLGNDFLKSHPYDIDYDKEMITWKLAD